MISLIHSLFCTPGVKTTNLKKASSPKRYNDWYQDLNYINKIFFELCFEKSRPPIGKRREVRGVLIGESQKNLDDC